jgi:hypothetical protein
MCALTSAMVVAVALASAPADAQTIQPPYDANYTLNNLGPVPGLPTPYGGLTFLLGDPNTLLIGGAANTAAGEIYSIGVVRDADGHVTGFSGTATFYCDGAYNDGGVDWGPSDVLFLARWPVNEVGQVTWGSTTADKIVDLAALGVGGGGPGALTFVPPGQPGAGQLKICSWPDGLWYELAISPDGTGTYDITAADLRTTIGGGPEGFIYVPTGSPDFSAPSVLVSEWSANNVAAYEVNGSGDPIPATRTAFITGLDGAEGATTDPISGDFLFSTFGASTDVVLVVEGFAAPEPIEVAIPTLGGPGVAAFVVVLLLAGVFLIWRRYG